MTLIEQVRYFYECKPCTCKCRTNSQLVSKLPHILMMIPFRMLFFFILFYRCDDLMVFDSSIRMIRFGKKPPFAPLRFHRSADLIKYIWNVQSLDFVQNWRLTFSRIFKRRSTFPALKQFPNLFDEPVFFFLHKRPAFPPVVTVLAWFLLFYVIIVWCMPIDVMYALSDIMGKYCMYVAVQAHCIRNSDR